MQIAYVLLAAVGAPSPSKRKPIKEKKQKKIKKKFLSFFLFHNIEKMRK
jgi:hypothetical protein